MKLSVHEVVPDAMVQRGLVEARDVPGDEDDDPDAVADAGAEQEAEQPTQPADPGERHEQVARQEEHGQRPAHGDDRERDAEVGDQDVLEHVHALQVPLADRVDRRDDREHRHDHAGRRRAGSASTVRGRRGAGAAAASRGGRTRSRRGRRRARAAGTTRRATGSRSRARHPRRQASVCQPRDEDGPRSCPAGANRSLHVHVPDAGEVGARPVDRADGRGQVGAVA